MGQFVTSQNIEPSPSNSANLAFWRVSVDSAHADLAAIATKDQLRVDLRLNVSETVTSTQIAEACGVSQRQIYNLKTKFPRETPASFNDVDEWKKFVDAHRVVVAAKRHAPRSDAGLRSDHAALCRCQGTAHRIVGRS